MSHEPTDGERWAHQLGHEAGYRDGRLSMEEALDEARYQIKKLLAEKAALQAKVDERTHRDFTWQSWFDADGRVNFRLDTPEPE